MKEARKRASSSRKQIETGGRFKPPEGKSEIRVLPTPPDKERKSDAVFMEYNVHRDIGPNKRFGMCGNRPGESHKCWIDKKRAKLEKEGRTREAAKLAPQLMLAVQVAVRDQDTGDMVGPLLWEMSSGKSADAMGYKIRGVISSDRRNYVDAKKGYNLHFKRTGTGLKTKWSDLDHDDDPSPVSKGILKRLKPFVDSGLQLYNEQWLKDAYYGRDETKGENNMAAKKKSKAEDSDASASNASASDVSSSDVSSSDVSSSDASSSDASSSSSDASASDSKSKKKKKKSKSSDSDASASSSDASSSDASSSSSDASSSDASSSDSSSSASSSDASSSDASSSDSSSSSDASSSDAKTKKTKKRKPRADKGKPRKTKKKSKK
jgi:hypothetical protein